MPRTITIPEQTYQAGNYGPFVLDSFNENNCDAVRVRFTQPSGGFPPYQITAGFDGYEPSTVIYNGGLALGKDGITPLAEGHLTVKVGKTKNGKAAVSKATVSIILGGPLTTAITVEAI